MPSQPVKLSGTKSGTALLLCTTQRLPQRDHVPTCRRWTRLQVDRSTVSAATGVVLFPFLGANSSLLGVQPVAPQGERPGGGGVAVGLMEDQPSLVMYRPETGPQRVTWPGASQTFSVWSWLPETMRLPSALKATLVTKSSVSLEGEGFGALVRVPHPHRVVPAAADDAFAIGAERHAGDRLCVSLEGEGFGARCPRPTPSPCCHGCR